MGGTHAYSSVLPAGIRWLPSWWASPLVGLGAACGPHWCTLVQAICLYWCTLWCSSPLLVQEATLACTGVRWDLLVVTAGLGFQEEASGRPAGKQRGASSATRREYPPPSKPPFPSPHFHLNLVPLFGGIFSSYHSLR